jgi:hypothetical protein
MSRFAQALSNAGHQLVHISGGIYKLKRVRSADLIEFGHAELVGAADVGEALADIQSAAKIDAANPDQLEQVKAIQDRNKQVKVQKMMDRVAKNPKMLRGMADRLDAHVCAGVVAAGESVADDLRCGECEKADAQECGHDFEVLPEAAEYMEPIRFVMDEADADPDNGVMWVAMLPQTVRTLLAARVMLLTSSSARVRSFRGESSPSAASPQDRQNLRAVAE